jgi:hypothetical protein
LKIESVYFDPETGEYVLQNIFGTIADILGLGVKVSVPDLYADLPVLYSLVDLNVYLDSIPTFQLGQTFMVNDGTVAGLSGMQFSTTPFTFDEFTGFSGTPYTGPATADTDHDLVATPEPSTGFLLLMSSTLVYTARRYLRSHLPTRETT